MNIKKVLLAVAILPLMAMSADYPSKTIKIIVPSKAGGSTDTTARLFAETAKKYLKGAKFAIVNKGGAGGLIGFENISRAKADGYTLGLVFTPQLVAHIVSKKAKYTLDTFKILGNAAKDPGVIVVNEASPLKSIDDLVKAAKASKDKKLAVVVNGVGSDDFLAAKNFEKNNGVEFNLIPTKGSTEQKTEILGNHVDVSFMNLSQMLANHKAGKVRILAILDEKRAEVAPEIPSMKELGYKTYMTATRGFLIHKDVKPEIAAVLEKLVADVLADKEFIERATKSYIFLGPLSGADYKTYLEGLQAETQKVYDATPW